MYALAKYVLSFSEQTGGSQMQWQFCRQAAVCSRPEVTKTEIGKEMHLALSSLPLSLLIDHSAQRLPEIDPPPLPCPFAFQDHSKQKHRMGGYASYFFVVVCNLRT